MTEAHKSLDEDLRKNHDEEAHTNRDGEAHKNHDGLEEDHKNHEEGQNDDTVHVHDKIRDAYRALEEHGIHRDASRHDDEAQDEALVMVLYILSHFQRI